MENPSSYSSPSYSSPHHPQGEEGWFDWAYKGVDHTLPGNGGPECRDFLSLSQRCWESAVASLVGLMALLYAYPRLRLPVACPARYRNGEPLGKRVLLLLMCLTFGIELGFKFSTRQVIWLGNPCHVATMVQIFILAAPPSRIVTAAFRLHMHMLTGAPIAILFPVINTRLLPFETGVYFLQHILMLIIPFYLMKTGDPFIPEDLSDFKWASVSFGFLYIYHFLPLQFLAYHSQVNLNNMLCPAVSDPFHGKYYRLFAICHQIILIPTLGKIFVVIAKAFRLLPCDNLPDAPISEVFATANNCQPVCNNQCLPGKCCCSTNPSKSAICCSSSCCRANCCLINEPQTVGSFNPTQRCVSSEGDVDNASSGSQSCRHSDADSGISATWSCRRNKEQSCCSYSASVASTVRFDDGNCADPIDDCVEDRLSCMFGSTAVATDDRVCCTNATNIPSACCNNATNTMSVCCNNTATGVPSVCCNKAIGTMSSVCCNNKAVGTVSSVCCNNKAVGTVPSACCHNATNVPSVCCNNTTTAAAGKSQGEGDSGCPNFVTRRLVNGRVTNDHQSCDQSNQHTSQQRERRSSLDHSSSRGNGSGSGSGCGCGGGGRESSNGSSQIRHRSGSGSSRRQSADNTSSRGAMTMSEMDGRKNGHAKGH